MVLYIIDSCLIGINDNYYNRLEKEEITKKAQKWENISNLIIMLIVFSIIIIMCIKISTFAIAFYIGAYGLSFALYISILINILLKKEKNIFSDELKIIVATPIVLILVYEFIGNNIPNLLSVVEKYTIELFILKNIVKYFVVTFFISMDIFIFIKELYLFIKFKRKNKKECNNKKVFEKFDVLEYEYSNCKNKKRIGFVIGYIKDVIIFFYKLIIVQLLSYIYNVCVYILLVLRKIIKRLTNEFSMYAIIVKTFYISSIISMLITYYLLLVDYKENNIVEVYSVIITTIIIPIMIEIIGDLKQEEVKNE